MGSFVEGLDVEVGKAVVVVVLVVVVLLPREGRGEPALRCPWLWMAQCSVEGG